MLPGNHSADAVSARGASGVSGGSSYAQLQSSIVCHESPAPPSLAAQATTDAPSPWFPLPRRVVLLVLCITAAIINYSDRQNISYAILKMAAELGWSDEKKGWVLSSFYLGYFLSNVPAGYATERFGGRRVMIGGAFFWSSFTLLTPPAATSSFPLLIIVRVLLGASEGFCWPAAHALLGRWFPTSERGRAVAFLNSGAFIGNLLTIAIAPPLITASGWPVSFYLFGGLGFVFIAAWMHLVHETPREHPLISADEVCFVFAHFRVVSVS
jgi:ACS family sodium-dependent inorganic phosphate cotransporter